MKNLTGPQKALLAWSIVFLIAAEAAKYLQLSGRAAKLIGLLELLRLQMGLTQQCTQAGLARLAAQRLLVFRPRVFPTVALKEQVGKKAVPPSRLGIQTRAPIGEARCQV